VAELVAGRWQVPLALVAIALGGLAGYRLMPRPPKVDFDALLADVTLLQRAGQTTAAADAAANLIDLKPELPELQRAILHDRLADLLFAVEQAALEHNPTNLTQFLEHSAAARKLGQPAAADANVRDAQAQQWLGHAPEAIAALQAALHQNLAGDQRRAAVYQFVKLLEHSSKTGSQRREALDQLLTDTTLPLPYVWWGLRTAVQTALADNDLPKARQFIADYGERLNHADLTGYLEHLRGWLSLRENQPEAAEAAAHWVDDWLGQEGRESSELDDLGYLPALNRILLGEARFALHDPVAALSAFAEALELQPDPEVRFATALGQGRAYAVLGEHAAARAAFRTALRKLMAVRVQFDRAVVQFQRTLLNLFDERRAVDDVPNAVAYLALAGALEPDTIDTHASVTETPPWDLDGAGEGDPLAWQNLQLATHFVREDEPRLAWLLWSAAETYNRTGRPLEVRRALEIFVRGRTDDARLPPALLRLGQACEASGASDQGLAWYQRVIREYPRLGEAARAKVLAAAALVSLGEEHYAEAEEILTDLLVGGTVAPDGPLYRDALLNLCELLFHEGRYADAISRLEDFLQLYPQDPERFRGQFALADAYRRSGYALRDQPPTGAEALAAQATSRQRFCDAAERFSQLLNDLETAAGADEALQLYARLAALYRGDCLFELNEPDALLAALAAYRSAAARYDGTPTALTARVQIANVLLRLGDVAEAARAIEGARWLLRSVPTEVCTPFNGGAHDHWEQFLATVASADLFAAAFDESDSREPGRAALLRTALTRAGSEER
jgi:tetratricopeptide (TPR) repeat protein